MNFVNYSNHPGAKWSEKQRQAAEEYGSIVDIPFREVPPEADEDDIALIADEEIKKIISCDPAVVLCQGEMTLMYALIRKLEKLGIPAIAACSKRDSIEKTDASGATVRESVFRFVRFRRYI